MHVYAYGIRLSQAYDAGACAYFYMAFIYTGKDPVVVFRDIEVRTLFTMGQWVRIAWGLRINLSGHH